MFQYSGLFMDNPFPFNLPIFSQIKLTQFYFLSKTVLVKKMQSLKTLAKQLLGYLPLVLALPGSQHNLGNTPKSSKL